MEAPTRSFRNDRPIQHQNEVIDIGALTFRVWVGIDALGRLRKSRFDECNRDISKPSASRVPRSKGKNHHFFVIVRWKLFIM